MGKRVVREWGKGWGMHAKKGGRLFVCTTSRDQFDQKEKSENGGGQVLLFSLFHRFPDPNKVYDSKLKKLK